MRNSTVQACVSTLAESVAQLPCELYKRKADGSREKATDHPLYDIIHNTPNNWMTAFEYHEFKQTSLGWRGNSIDYIEWDRKGHVKQLIPLAWDKIQVLKAKNGEPVYRNKETGQIFPFRNIHHVRWISKNGRTGLSPIQNHMDQIGLAIATERHAEKVFANGTTLSGVIERPEGAAQLDSDAVQGLKDGWVDAHAGLDNAFSVAVLQEGSKFNQLAMTNEEAQLLNTRKYGVNEIARIYKMPLHMIQHLEQSSWNNVEHMGLYYVVYTLVAWLKRHEGAMMRDLLTKEDRKDHFIEFNVAGLLRGDQKSRYEGLRKRSSMGLFVGQ